MHYTFEDPEHPEELLERIVKCLVANPEEVVIIQTESPQMTILTIEVLPEEIGKIIGRRGVIIQSLQTLFHAIGSRRRHPIQVHVKQD